MKNTIIIRGKIAYPSFATKNPYSNKFEFNLTFPHKDSLLIENEIRKIADSQKTEGFYNKSIKTHAKIKPGTKLSEELKDRNFIKLQQDNHGWKVVDVDGNDLELDQLGYGDFVKVLISIVPAVHPKYGNQVYLNPKIIKLIESAGHNEDNVVYSFDDGGDEFGEDAQDDQLVPPNDDLPPPEAYQE